MERLKYIEILCLRVSEGLGTERDFKRLKAAGIDPEEWIGLSSLLKQALRTPSVHEFSSVVCEDLALDVLDIGTALAPAHVPDLRQGIYQSLDIVDSAVDAPPLEDQEGSASLVEIEEDSDELFVLTEDIASSPPIAELMEDSSEDMELELLNADDEVALEETVLPSELQSAEEELSLGAVLGPQSVPDLTNSIMSIIGQDIATEVEVEEDEDEIFVLHQLLEEPKIEHQEVESIENTMELPLAEALKADSYPDMVDFIMGEVMQTGVPVPHLRLVTHAENAEQEQKKNAHKERMGEVDVEIQDIKSPLVIDGDHAAGNWATALMCLFAVAAAWLIISTIYPASNEVSSSGDVTMAQSLEIISIESEGNIQIHPVNGMTIIFIEDSVEEK